MEGNESAAARERELAAAFERYMLAVSAEAEQRARDGVPAPAMAAEQERADALVKETDAYLRPYMEEFLGTVLSLSRAFAAEIADDMED
ncbi:MAG: hypothetical protein IJL69_04745 [Oscillospiraceae bacterium]|nr:hypothetical protein [Oscillospiraceae bacterium]